LGRIFRENRENKFHRKTSNNKVVYSLCDVAVIIGAVAAVVGAVVVVRVVGTVVVECNEDASVSAMRGKM